LIHIEEPKAGSLFVTSFTISSWADPDYQHEADMHVSLRLD